MEKQLTATEARTITERAQLFHIQNNISKLRMRVLNDIDDTANNGLEYVVYHNYTDLELKGVSSADDIITGAAKDLEKLGYTVNGSVYFSKDIVQNKDVVLLVSW